MFRYAKAVASGRLLRWNRSFGAVSEALGGRAAALGPGFAASFEPYRQASEFVIQALFHPVVGCFHLLAPSQPLQYRSLIGVLIGAYTHSLNWFESATTRESLVIDLGVDGISAGVDEYWQITPPTSPDDHEGLNLYVERIRDAALNRVLFFSGIDSPPVALPMTFALAFSRGANIANRLRGHRHSAAA